MLALGFLGRLSKEKGLHVLVKAASNLECFLRVGGTGSGLYFDHVLDLMKKAKNCTYEGFIDDTKTFLDDIDVVVLPSLIEEALPTVLIEGMARKCIIISSNFPSVKEIVDCDLNYIVEPGNEVQIQDAIQEIREMCPENIEAIKKLNYKRASNKFRLKNQSTLMKDFLYGQ